ncbi:unnamed protein product [Hyaloperonospora brassicae]|uniref:Caffeoyl-CoA O-methyltransferase n=1 Tax=Hyaloperonospora brassicae TaxID=162125 RepID=A0AAV0UCW1_HYABA|nr:unnamed protein product [Hyaloperonospora brassicae]
MQQRTQYWQPRASEWTMATRRATPTYVSKRLHTSSLARELSTRCFSTSRAVRKHIDASELQQTYAYDQSSGLNDDALLSDLRAETMRDRPKAEQLIDEMQGKFLSFLVQTTKAQRVLEIGCFTGYSALCLASGLAADGVLTTCDVDAACMQFAQRFFNKSPRAAQITAVHQDGLEFLHSITRSACADQQPFDVIFVDANKRKYRAYYDFILEHHLLHASGLLVFDNTLFRGRVAVCASGEEGRKERIARSLADFNSHVLRDPRTAQVVLPLWDGLTLIRLSGKGMAAE